MTFTINSITRCSGLLHYTFNLTVGAQTFNLLVTRDEFDLEPSEMREAFISRVRSAVKEANASTFTQIQNALVGNTFEI